MGAKFAKPGPGESLLERFPDVAEQWHPTRNGSLTPADVKPRSMKKVWWQCPENADHEYEATLGNRAGGKGCPYCSGRRINHTNSLAALRPDLAAEWDTALNGDLTPHDVGLGSNKRVWWRCPKGPDHVWPAQIANRTTPSVQSGCAVCAGRHVVPSISLATLHPEVASEWHPEKNGALTPDNVTALNTRKVWWQCARDATHEWQAAIQTRAGRGYGCPYCSGHRATPENNLAVSSPELAREWHPTENGDLQPTDVLPQSNRKVWWICPKGPDHEFESSVYNRVQAPGCPCCSGQRCVPSNSLATVNPQLAAQWHPTKNGQLTPHDVTGRSGKKVWWICANDPKHEWRQHIFTRAKGVGCSRCARTGFNPSKEGWLYLIEHPVWGFTQIGITNFPDDRLGTHRHNGWELVDLRGPEPGDLVERNERAALTALKKRGAEIGTRQSSRKFDGHTESWPSTTLSVSSLSQILNWIRDDEDTPE